MSRVHGRCSSRRGARNPLRVRALADSMRARRARVNHFAAACRNRNAMRAGTDEAQVQALLLQRQARRAVRGQPAHARGCATSTRQLREFAVDRRPEVANLGEKLGLSVLAAAADDALRPATCSSGFLASLPGRRPHAVSTRSRRRPRRQRWPGARESPVGPRAPTLRHALEVRRASFVDPALIEPLRRHDVALVSRRAPRANWPRSSATLAPRISSYIRLHGDEELY